MPHTLIMLFDEQTFIFMNSDSVFSFMVSAFWGCSQKYLLTPASCLLRHQMPLRPFPSKFCALYPLCYHTGILALSSSPVWSFISWQCRIQMSFLESAASHHLKDQLACWPGKFPLKRQPRIFFSCSISWPYLSLVRTLHPNPEQWPPWLPLGEVFHS